LSLFFFQNNRNPWDFAGDSDLRENAWSPQLARVHHLADGLHFVYQKTVAKFKWNAKSRKTLTRYGRTS